MKMMYLSVRRTYLWTGQLKPPKGPRSDDFLAVLVTAVTKRIGISQNKIFGLASATHAPDLSQMAPSSAQPSLRCLLVTSCWTAVKKPAAFDQPGNQLLGLPFPAIHFRNCSSLAPRPDAQKP